MVAKLDIEADPTTYERALREVLSLTTSDDNLSAAMIDAGGTHVQF